MAICPEDITLIHTILRNMGISEYEDGVENLLLDYMDKYVTTLTEDAFLYSNHADKNSIDVEDVKLAVELLRDRNYVFHHTRELAASFARQNNLRRLYSGIHLYPNRCSLSCNNHLKSATTKQRNVCTAPRVSSIARATPTKKQTNPIISPLSPASSTLPFTFGISNVNAKNLRLAGGKPSDKIQLSNDVNPNKRSREKDNEYAKKQTNPIISPLSPASSTLPFIFGISNVNAQNLRLAGGKPSDEIQLSNDVNPNKRSREKDNEYAEKEISPITSTATLSSASSTSPVSSVNSSLKAQNLTQTVRILSDEFQLSNDINPNKRPRKVDDKYANKQNNSITSIAALSSLSSTSRALSVNSSVNAQNLKPSVGILSDETQLSNDVIPDQKPHEKDHTYANKGINPITSIAPLSPASSTSPVSSVNSSVNAQNSMSTMGILSNEIQLSNDVNTNKRPCEEDDACAYKEINPITSVAALSPASSTSPVNTSVNVQNLMQTVEILSEEIQISNDVNPNKRPHEEDGDYANKEINPITSVAALSPASSTSPVNTSVNAQNLMQTVEILSDEIQISNDVNPDKRPQEEDDLSSASSTAPVSPVNSSVNAQNLMPSVGILSDEIKHSNDDNSNKRPHKDDGCDD